MTAGPWGRRPETDGVRPETGRSWLGWPKWLWGLIWLASICVVVAGFTATAAAVLYVTLDRSSTHMLLVSGVFALWVIVYLLMMQVMLRPNR